MEGTKQPSSSSSSFTTELFGSKESPSSSSSGLFNSIFPRPSQAHGKNYITSEVNNDSATKRDCVDKEGKNRSPKNKDSTLCYEQERSQPCHLSSSIYYGGQDVYTNPRVNKSDTGYSTQYNKDEEDDGHASRGNWWQGSLYY